MAQGDRSGLVALELGARRNPCLVARIGLASATPTFFGRGGFFPFEVIDAIAYGP
jgi:hypothetical protein